LKTKRKLRFASCALQVAWAGHILISGKTIGFVASHPGLRINDGRKPVPFCGLLRNSTIFRCAKNRDSNSPRRKPPQNGTGLSSDLTVIDPQPRMALLRLCIGAANG
jgi:hypothetical protein